MALEGMIADEDTTLQQRKFHDKITQTPATWAALIKITLAAEKQISKE